MEAIPSPSSGRHLDLGFSRSRIQARKSPRRPAGEDQEASDAKGPAQKTPVDCARPEDAVGENSVRWKLQIPPPSSGGHLDLGSSRSQAR